MSTNAFTDVLEDDLGILLLTGGAPTITGLLAGTAHENIHCGLVLSGMDTGVLDISATETLLETGTDVTEEIEALGATASATNYARVDISSNTGVGAPTMARISAGLFRNGSAITFPTCGDDYDKNGAGLKVTHVTIVDTSTLLSGNVMFWGRLTTDREVLNGDTFSFPANQLSIEFQ